MAHEKRVFLKIHVGVDVKTKKILSLKITDDHSHDAKHPGPELVQKASQKGNVVKVPKLMGHMIQKIIFHICITTQMHYLQSRSEKHHPSKQNVIRERNQF